MDILGTHFYDQYGELLLFKNNGNEVFEQVLINSYNSHPLSIGVNDMDNDQDIDVVTGGTNGITWLVNDGYENFSEYIVQVGTVCRSVYLEDIDIDNDMDILAALLNENKIVCYEHLSNNLFSPFDISTNAWCAMAVNAGDMDNDGDVDVLLASACDNKIAWYENLMISTRTGGSFKPQASSCKLEVYPNPASTVILVEYNIEVGNEERNEMTSAIGGLAGGKSVKLNIIDVYGRKVMSVVDEEQSPGDCQIPVNVSFLPDGMYLIELKVDDVIETIKLIKQ